MYCTHLMQNKSQNFTCQILNVVYETQTFSLGPHKSFLFLNSDTILPSSQTLIKNENILQHCIYIVHLTCISLIYCEPETLFHRTDLKFCRAEDGKQHLQHIQKNMKSNSQFLKQETSDSSSAYKDTVIFSQTITIYLNILSVSYLTYVCMCTKVRQFRVFCTPR